MLKMLGIRLPEDLVKRIKEYVKEEKKVRIYSIGEFIRVVVEEYLNNQNKIR